LEILFNENTPQAVVMPMDIKRFQSSALARDRLWEILLQEQPPVSAQTAAAGLSMRDKVSVLPVEQQRAYLQSYVQTVLGLVLRMSPEKIEPNTPLGSLGLDSLMAVEFRNRLEMNLGLKLSSTLVWNYPTAYDITSFLLGKLELPAAPVQQPVPQLSGESQPESQKNSEVLKQVQSMSEADALQALMKRRKGN